MPLFLTCPVIKKFVLFPINEQSCVQCTIDRYGLTGSLAISGSGNPALKMLAKECCDFIVSFMFTK
jgi:hypothetical protein